MTPDLLAYIRTHYPTDADLLRLCDEAEKGPEYAWSGDYLYRDGLSRGYVADDGYWSADTSPKAFAWTHDGTATGTTPIKRRANARKAVEDVLRKAGIGGRR